METMEATPVQAPAPISAPVLTLNDRCDAGSCGAAARAEASSEGAPSTLLFCGHHAKKHERALLVQGWRLNYAE